MDQAGKAKRTLTDAMRAIRINEAERTGVVVALREADLARLEILHDRMTPVLAEVPQGQLPRAEDVAWAIGILLDPSASAMNGSTLFLDGGSRRGIF